MRSDKDQVLKLRKQNKSYNEISKILGISKSTLSGWLKNDKESHKIKLALTSKENPIVANRIKNFVKNNQEKWERWREQARQKAKIEFSKLKNKQLFIAGLMLYWAEGDSKLKNPFRFTNTDSRMIALYVKFLTKILKIPKQNLKLTMILYPDLSEQKCAQFWNQITNIPKSQFYKTQFIKGRHPTSRLSNGICLISCGNRQLKEKVNVWIDLLSKKL